MDAARLRSGSARRNERGQASLQFESVTDTLARLEQEITGNLRAEIEQTRKEEAETRRRGDAGARRACHADRPAQLTRWLDPRAQLLDRHGAQTLPREQRTTILSAVGTLADFLEVEGQYETVVDEYLRDELNYIVVKSWDAADEGMRLLKNDVDGRATFLVHPARLTGQILLRIRPSRLVHRPDVKAKASSA